MSIYRQRVMLRRPLVFDSMVDGEDSVTVIPRNSMVEVGTTEDFNSDVGDADIEEAARVLKELDDE